MVLSMASGCVKWARFPVSSTRETIFRLVYSTKTTIRYFQYFDNMDNEMNSLDQQLDWKAVELVGNPPTIPLGHGQARNADSKSTSRASFMNNSGKMIMGKRCQYPGGCDRRAQTFQRCKRHGGGARCIVEGCNRCSQGRKKCRAHGGSNSMNILV